MHSVTEVGTVSSSKLYVRLMLITQMVNSKQRLVAYKIQRADREDEQVKN